MIFYEASYLFLFYYFFCYRLMSGCWGISVFQTVFLFRQSIVSKINLLFTCFLWLAKLSFFYQVYIVILLKKNKNTGHHLHHFHLKLSCQLGKKLEMEHCQVRFLIKNSFVKMLIQVSHVQLLYKCFDYNHWLSYGHGIETQIITDQDTS